jgi:uncharacterized protein YdeI (YjbR/CyaY-like superfamily)
LIKHVSGGQSRPSTDPRIDAYIEKQAAFAQPILAHIRAAVHRACPAAEETLKWSMPAFTYKSKILATMAAFKAHAAFGFWQGREVTGAPEKTSGMGQFGRLTGIADLPPEPELDALIARAAALIDSGAKAPRPVKHAKTDINMPEDLAAALAENPPAQAALDAFPPSARREYLEWVTSAKQAGTRARRVATTVEQLAEGKRLHWKYEKC